MAPKLVNPSRPERCPSWNTHTSAPNVAPRDRVFMASALTGTSTEPVIRNSRTNVEAAMRPRAYGSRLEMLVLEVQQGRGLPGDVRGEAGTVGAQRLHELLRVRALGLPVGHHVQRGVAVREVGADRDVGDVRQLTQAGRRTRRPAGRSGGRGRRR